MRLFDTIALISAFILISLMSAGQSDISPVQEFKKDIIAIENHFGIEKLKSEVTLSAYQNYVNSTVATNYSSEIREMGIVYHTMNFYEYKRDFIGVTHQRLKIITNFSSFLTEEELLHLTIKTGDGYVNTDNFSLANYFFEKCLTNKEVDKHSIYSKIGKCFLESNFLDSAIHYSKKALKYSPTISSDLSLINSIGYAHFLKGDYHTALRNYNSVIEKYNGYEGHLDPMHYYNSLSNIGSAQFKLNEFDEALSTFQLIDESEFYVGTGREFKFEVQSKKFLVYSKTWGCQELNEKLVELETLANEIKSEGVQSRFLEIRLENRIQCGTKQEIKDAVSRLDSIRAKVELEKQKSILLSQGLNQLIYNDQLSITKANLALENESKELLQESNSRLRTSMFLGFLSIAGFFMFFIYWRRQKRKKEKLKFEFDSMSLDNKRLQLMNLINQGESNSILFEEIGNKLESILKSSTPEDDISNMIQFVKSQRRSELEREKIIELTEDLGDGLIFKSKFCTEYPELTTTEIQVIMLIRIGLSNKDIATFRNIEPHSIRIFKNRLKGKLKLDVSIDLNSYIKEY